MKKIIILFSTHDDKRHWLVNHAPKRNCRIYFNSPCYIVLSFNDNARINADKINADSIKDNYAYNVQAFDLAVEEAE